jgi:glycosyltransferase involved in cell wall biosynthesis/peptidoglycan/xylan/chitin deacetylase (PgdA/CDA1 family)
MLRNKLYYGLKPFIPQSFRKAIRRKVARRLRDRIGSIWPIALGSEHPPDDWPGWPKNKKFALILTHDVESAVGLRKCRKLMQFEMELGFRSSFNFVPEGDYRLPRELREELVQNGFEIGIHDLKHDGRLYQSRQGFSEEARRINHYLAEWGAVGFRSAFMFHELDWLHELNIRYDSSTFDTDPFEPQPEGHHTIFPLWIPRSNRSSATGQSLPSAFNSSRSGYVELPYTLPQDSTLFIFLQEKTPAIWLRKLDWIAEHGGMALVLTHPDYMAMNGSTPKSGEYPIDLYRQLLEYIQYKYAGAYWLGLPREIAAYAEQTMFWQAPALKEVDLKQPLADREKLTLNGAAQRYPTSGNKWRLRGKRAAVLLFSYYPTDPRPRRAAEALADEGVTVDLFCLQSSPDEPRCEFINGVNVFRLRLRRHRGSKIKYVHQYAAFILRSFAHLTFHSVLRRYDLVHVHNMPDVLVFSAWVPKALGAKIILDLHDPVPELMQTIFQLPEQSFSVRLLKQLEKWSIGFADLVLTVNLACKKIYTSRSCPPQKINVVLNSPEDKVFQFQPPALHAANGEKSVKPFRILYHGSLVHRNGFDLAVDALEHTRKSIPRTTLMVCGEQTSFFEAVMESAEKRGLQKSIQYLGRQNRRQIVEAINSCDLGIIPNHSNIFTEINTPTRIFEYLALGKPVIAPGTRGIRDYFADDELIFFNVGDANDLARKIEFVFSNPNKVREIVERGQRVYLAHRWSQEKSNLLDAISELL